MTRTLTPFQKWALALEVPRLHWERLDTPSESELVARCEAMCSAAGRELGDVALAQVLVAAGCLDYLDTQCR